MGYFSCWMVRRRRGWLRSSSRPTLLPFGSLPLLVGFHEGARSAFNFPSVTGIGFIVLVRQCYPRGSRLEQWLEAQSEPATPHSASDSSSQIGGLLERGTADQRRRRLVPGRILPQDATLRDAVRTLAVASAFAVRQTVTTRNP